VVDADADSRSLAVEACRLPGYQVFEAGSGEEALEIARSRRADIVLTEWVLPDISGTQMIRELRRNGFAIPILFLTGRSHKTDEVVGLEVGADDYIVKPFDPRVLVARIKAHLRRSTAAEGGGGREGVTVVGGLQIDHSGRRVRVGDDEVPLTMTEFNLLDVLASHPERVLSRAQLRDKVWDRTHNLDDHSVDPHVQRLRRKIFHRPQSGVSLDAVPGLGYRLSVRPT